MADTFSRIWQNIYLRVLLIAVLLWTSVWLLRATQIVWISFLIAFLIAYLVEPFVSRLERTRVVPRPVGVILSMSIILLFLVVGTLLLGDVLVQLSVLPAQITPFFEDLPGRLKVLEDSSPPWLQSFLSENTTYVQSFLQEQQTALGFTVQGWARRFVRSIGAIFGGLGRVIFIVFLAGFIISGYKGVQESFYKLFPPRYRPLVTDLSAKLDLSVGGYVRAKFIESIIVGLVVWIVLALLGIPKAPALAFIAALLNPIPYLGPSLATVPIVLSALTIGLPQAILVFVIMVVIQVLDGNVLQPVLLAQSVSVHPVTILVALLAGGTLFGFWGVLLAIPIAAFLHLVYSDYYLKSKWYLGDSILSPLTTLEPDTSVTDQASMGKSTSYD